VLYAGTLRRARENASDVTLVSDCLFEAFLIEDN